ncbi:hypothetical protein ACLOJK_018761 [Asimina triloba]
MYTIAGTPQGIKHTLHVHEFQYTTGAPKFGSHSDPLTKISTGQSHLASSNQQPASGHSEHAQIFKSGSKEKSIPSHPNSSRQFRIQHLPATHPRRACRSASIRPSAAPNRRHPMARSGGPCHPFEQNPIQKATGICLQSIRVASGPPKSTTSDEPADLHPGHGAYVGQQES